MLECVVNVSEGRDTEFLAGVSDDLEPWLLDVHSDTDHNRSVFTLVGVDAPRVLARRCTGSLDLATHEGVHPRLGVVDVVPFVPLEGSTFADAVRARDEFARWIAAELGVPAFVYGTGTTLPDIRRMAWRTLAPTTGPSQPHPTAGAVCVGARNVLVAYNVWLATDDVTVARQIAGAVRSPSVRALGLATGPHTQVSMNLVEPSETGPATAHDSVRDLARDLGVEVLRAELVGLLPRSVLDGIPRARWEELDVDDGRTIEQRLESRGLSR